MKYPIIRNKKYDYIREYYHSLYPNLHKYPATMLPQIGIDILKELHISNGKLLDPYCGSGSSFTSALECGIQQMYGYDLNPLAVLLSRVKFTKISPVQILKFRKILYGQIYDFIKSERNFYDSEYPPITNMNFWFSKDVAKKLLILKKHINTIQDRQIQNFFLLPFSETVRDCSYTRNNEFKLFRMKPKDILYFNPDVISIYFKKLDDTLFNYQKYYLPKLKKNFYIDIREAQFAASKDKFDIVLTSPPYGDSKTTVAYGQFSALSNEWLGIRQARQLDNRLMGGKRIKDITQNGLISEYIQQIFAIDPKRALEVSSFYNDLGNSIKEIAASINKKGKVIYIVGNRTVKNIQLPTDQFIAEKFEEYGFKHLFTYKRALTNKSMPLKNSPSNKKGELKETISSEYIVVCEKNNN